MKRLSILTLSFIFLLIIFLLVGYLLYQFQRKSKISFTPTPYVQTTLPTQFQITRPLPIETNNEEALQKLGIKVAGFYKEFTAKLNTFHPAQLAYYTDACKKGGYNLSAYVDETLAFTGYKTDVSYKREILNAWVINKEDKIVCISLAVGENSTLAPGIFAVNDPNLKFPSK